MAPKLDITALSQIAGCISIACWVVVFSPQIIENFRRSSAEGLSIVFVVIWLVGDVFNILGGVMQGILPTMVGGFFSFPFFFAFVRMMCYRVRVNGGCKSKKGKRYLEL